MVTALILSGGTGKRLGSEIPKQYIEVAGKPIIIYCLEAICASNNIDAFQIVADSAWEDQIHSWMNKYNLIQKFHGFSTPGETRQLSIYSGLKDIAEFADDEDLVFIHDAARPFLSEDLVGRCVVAAKGHDGVLPVLPMKDTIYLSEDGKAISSLLDRKQVFAGQAPEVFVLGKYMEANTRLIKSGEIKMINGSTEPAILAGMDIAMINGDESNIKITTMSDLNHFKRMMKDN